MWLRSKRRTQRAPLGQRGSLFSRLSWLAVYQRSLLLMLAFITPPGFASDYYDEHLLEVLRNANLRLGPSIESPRLAIVPGGYVVSVIGELGADDDWVQVVHPFEQTKSGFISRSLLAPTHFSYELIEVETDISKIKYFKVNSNYTIPFTFARLYDRDGKYQHSLPDTRDLTWVVGAPARLRLRHLDTEFPYFEVRNWSGGRNCCYSARYFSKKPPFSAEFDIKSRIIRDWEKTEDGKWAITVADESFKYWRIEAWFFYGAISPIQAVRLELVEGGAVVSKDLMARPAYSESELKGETSELIRLSDELPEEDRGRAMYLLADKLLEFIFAGNAAQAYEILDSYWDEGFMLDYVDGPDRDQFKDALIKKVRASVYYQPWMLNESN